MFGCHQKDISNKVKRPVVDRPIIVLLIGLVGVQNPLVAQTVITQWNFNGTSDTTVPGGTSAPAPSTGAGSVQLIGGTTAIFDSGVGSADALASPPNYSLRTMSYPVSGSNERTAGILINVSTAGFNSLSLVFDQRLSNTSANTWAVYYTTDATAGTPAWQQVKVFTFVPAPTGTGDMWYNQRTVDLSVIPLLSDNPNAAFKIVSAFDPVALNYLAARSTSTYASTGNSRFDMITVSGVPLVIIHNAEPVASAVAVSGIFSVGDVLHAAYTYSDAEGDTEGISIYKWYRASDASGSDEAPIVGADALTYTITSDDLNKFISFEVTPVAQTGGSPGNAVKTPYEGPVLQLGDPAVVKINEVYSRGIDTNDNPDLRSDWVEFYNPGLQDVTLAGLGICDSGQCQSFPTHAYAQLIVPAGGFLALGEDAPNSFTFGLSSLGEYVVLKQSNNVTIDSLNFPALEDTQSYGRYFDGAANLLRLIPPSRGTTNNNATPMMGDPSVIRINEIYSGGNITNTNPDLRSDWAEFFNPGAQDVTLAGLQLCNSSGCQAFAASAYDQLIVPAGGFLALAEGDVNSFSFGLSSLGEHVALKRSNGIAIDSLIFPALGDTVSYGRYPDGANDTARLFPPSKGISNNNAAPVEDAVTGIRDNSTSTQLFPVPTTGDLMIESTGDSIQHISVLNANGQEVCSVNSAGKTTRISLSGMKSGLYILRLTDQNGHREVRRVIKE